MDTISSDQLVEQTLIDANKDLAKHLGGDVLSIKAPMMQPVDDIVRTEVEGICERQSIKQKRATKIIVLVETEGGFVETVERIVSVLRRHYETVEFIIPNFAYSAGTLLVMSGDEIYMDYYSVLGPIDPQYPGEDGKYVPGMGYLAKFQELLERVNDPPNGDDSKVKAELAILIKKFDPAKLFDIEQSVDHAKSLLKEWLPKYKFKDWGTTSTGKTVDDNDKIARADEIAAVLGDAKRWHSHGRGITIRELESEEIKLKIKDFGADPKLNATIRHYHGLFIDYLRKRGIRGALHSTRGVRRVI